MSALKRSACEECIRNVPIRENNFARRLKERLQEKQQERKLVVERDVQPTIDEQLVRLEDDIRRLKVEFDIYFNGSAKRPPYDTKGRVETIIKRLADERTFTYAQRYHYNSIVARYTAFRDLWRRTLQDREEGRGPLAERRAAQLQQSKVAATTDQRATFICNDAKSDIPTVKNLYDALVEAKRACGEPVDEFSFSQFHRAIAAKTDALKERLGCERVRYSVVMKDGHVSFKAKAEK